MPSEDRPTYVADDAVHSASKATLTPQQVLESPVPPPRRSRRRVGIGTVAVCGIALLGVLGAVIIATRGGDGPTEEAVAAEAGSGVAADETLVDA